MRSSRRSQPLVIAKKLADATRADFRQTCPLVSSGGNPFAPTDDSVGAKQRHLPFEANVSFASGGAN
jgi:hypothetical protein